MLKTLYRSALTVPGKTKALLSKIKAKRLVFEVGSARFDARHCTGVAIDENAAGGASPNITFTRPGGASPENYDLADIYMIRRLRTKKWLIKIRGNANPA